MPTIVTLTDCPCSCSCSFFFLFSPHSVSVKNSPFHGELNEASPWMWRALLKQLSAKTKTDARRNPISFIRVGNWPVGEKEKERGNRRRKGGIDPGGCGNVTTGPASWVPPGNRDWYLGGGGEWRRRRRERSEEHTAELQSQKSSSYAVYWFIKWIYFTLIDTAYLVLRLHPLVNLLSTDTV